jgi:hypothetical protein
VVSGVDVVVVVLGAAAGVVATVVGGFAVDPPSDPEHAPSSVAATIAPASTGPPRRSIPAG